MVEVWFDPKVLSFEQLLAHGESKECARKVWREKPKQFRLDKEQKYYLLQTPLARLPMSEAQACRVNASLAGDAYLKWLSPAQRANARKLIVAAAKARSGD